MSLVCSTFYSLVLLLSGLFSPSCLYSLSSASFFPTTFSASLPSLFAHAADFLPHHESFHPNSVEGNFVVSERSVKKSNTNGARTYAPVLQVSTTTPVTNFCYNNGAFASGVCVCPGPFRGNDCSYIYEAWNLTYSISYSTYSASVDTYDTQLLTDLATAMNITSVIASNPNVLGLNSVYPSASLPTTQIVITFFIQCNNVHLTDLFLVCQVDFTQFAPYTASLTAELTDSTSAFRKSSTGAQVQSSSLVAIPVPTTATPTTGTPTTASVSSSGGSSSSAVSGTIIGVISGVGGGITVLVVVFVVLWYRRKFLNSFDQNRMVAMSPIPATLGSKLPDGTYTANPLTKRDTTTGFYAV